MWKTKGSLSDAKKLEKQKEREVNLNAMFKAVKLPAGVTDLNTGLADVDRDTLSHFGVILRSDLRVLESFDCRRNQRVKNEGDLKGTLIEMSVGGSSRLLLSFEF